MGVPKLTVQAALDSKPGDETYTWTTIHDPDDADTQPVGALRWSRGRPNEYDRVETGTGRVDVGDAASLFDPRNTGSVYYPNVKRMRPIRAFATIDGTDYPLFNHLIERLPRTVRVGTGWTERQIATVDAFAWFALAGLKGQSFSAEMTGERWGSVLDAIEWPSARRDLDTGSSELDAISFDDNDSTKALEHLLKAADDEQGLGFIDASGDAKLIARHSLITQFTSSQATFADGPSFATGDYPDAILAADLLLETTEVVNQWTGKRPDGTTQSASDSDSVDEYGPSSREVVDSLLASDAELLAQLQWRLARSKQPRDRIDSIVARPGGDLDVWAALLGLEVGDRVTVVEWPPGFDEPLEVDMIIRHLDAEIPYGATADARFVFQLAEADTEAGWVLGTSLLGQDTRLIY